VRYTTELTEPVDFYLRGEEYSAQLAHFVDRVRARRLDGINTFESAVETDKLIERMIEDSQRGPSVRLSDEVAAPAPSRRSFGTRLRDAARALTAAGK
jgi:predicted dehydrogenase